MGLWQIIFGDDDSEAAVDTVPGGTHRDNSTSTHSTITINSKGSNYDERIEGKYTKEELQQRLSNLQQDANERVADGNYDERINIDF